MQSNLLVQILAAVSTRSRIIFIICKRAETSGKI